MLSKQPKIFIFLIVIGIVLLIFLWLSGDVTAIKQVHEQGRVGTIVHLKGTVGDRIPLLNAQVYELQDATGSIWILTDDTPLQSGETVRIKGKVRYQNIVVEGQDLSEVYVEQQKVLSRE
jgi:uncharacterized protein YdeI (BOF family)